MQWRWGTVLRDELAIVVGQSVEERMKTYHEYKTEQQGRLSY